MKNLLLAAFLAAAFISSAQSVNPNYNYPELDTVFSWGNGADANFPWGGFNAFTRYGVDKVSKDSNGNYYLMGNYNGTIDLDPGPSLLQSSNSLGEGFFLIKMNPQKSLVWARSWSGNGFSSLNHAQIEGNGDIYLLGSFTSSSFDADPISSQFLIGRDSLFGQGSVNGLAVKLDSNGSFLWAQTIIGASFSRGYIRGNQLILGGVFVGGIDTNITGSAPGFYQNSGGGFHVAKLNKNTGLKLNIESYGSSGGVWVNDFIINSQGNYMFTGYLFGNNFDFDPSPNSNQLVTINASNQAYFLELDTNFQYVNHMTLTGSGRSRLYKINQVNTDYWLTGQYLNSSNIDLDPGPMVIQPNAPNNITEGSCFLKFSANLNLTKAYYHPHEIDGPFFNPKVLTKGLNVYLASTYEEEVFLEPTKTNGLQLDPTFQGAARRRTSFYVVKLDNNDSLDWAYYPERLNQSTSRARVRDLIWDDDALLTIGNFAGMIDFDMASTDTANQTSANWSNFMLRLNDCTTPDSLPEVNRKYTHCGLFTYNNSTLFGNRWHRIDIPLAGSQGCDSILQKDSVFVFTNPPTLADSTTFLVAEQAAGLTIEWYNCATGQVVQSGGTRFYPQQPGNYGLIYATPDSAQTCKDTLPCQSINQIGLPENQENLWKLYPNPVQETLTFTGPMRQITGLRVLQINGQEVLRLKVQKQLNLSSLAPGMYLLEISSPNGTINKKFVKE